MPWNKGFDEGSYEWPLEAYVNVEYLLNLPINGSGGWQNLLEFLQDNVDEEEETIHLDADDVERILRYANCYRTGGYQRHLTEIITDDDVWYFSRYHWCDNVGNASPFDDS